MKSVFLWGTQRSAQQRARKFEASLPELAELAHCFDLDDLEEVRVDGGYVGQEGVTASSHLQAPLASISAFQ